MKELLLHEVEFKVTFEGSYQVVHFDAFDANSTIDGVVCRREYNEDGVFTRDQPALLVRDRGNPGKRPEAPRYAVVVRRMGRATPCPAFCGAFVGRFVTENGNQEWYVFAPHPHHSPEPHPLVSQSGRGTHRAPAPVALASTVSAGSDVSAAAPGASVATGTFGMEE